MTPQKEFGDLLREYRRRCTNKERGKKRLSQADFAELLSYRISDGSDLVGQTISNYELGKTTIHKDDRRKLLGIVAILYENGGLRTLTEADALLWVGNYRGLDAQEAEAINENWGGLIREGQRTQIDMDLPQRQPYKGLAVFDAADADLYFGRTTLVNTLLTQINSWHDSDSQRFLALVGASGSGKSSLVRAGLLPKLQARWHIHLLQPTKTPLTELAATLAPIEDATSLLDAMQADGRALGLYLRRKPAPSKPCLIVIDQFEELFTLCEDERERQAFIINLLIVAQGVAGTGVLITLRADFYQDCLAYDGLRKALNQAQGQMLLGSLLTDDILAIIEKPAELCNYRLEQGLSTAILHDCVGIHRQPDPTILPLLSMALLKTWQQRERERLTLAGYEATGRVQGAIAQEAELIFGRFTPQEQPLVRQLFLELTAIGETTNLYTRRHVPLNNLIDTLLRTSSETTDKAIDQILRKLIQARLITIGDNATVAVAHEALIRRWQRLAEWIENNRTWLRFSRQLERDAQAWQENGQDEGLLYRGIKLEQAKAESKTYQGMLSENAKKFLETSQAVLDREVRAREEAQERELTVQKRFVRVAATLSVVGILLAVMAGSLAFIAQREAEMARQLEIQSRSQTRAAESQNAYDPQFSMNLAIEAFELSDNPDTRRAMQQAATMPGHYQYTLPTIGQSGAFASPLAWSPDGQWLLTINASAHRATIWNAKTGQEQMVLQDNRQTGNVMRSAAWSQDSTQVATGSWDGMRLWNTQTGELLAFLALADVATVQWNTDDSQLAIVEFNTKSVIIWDKETKTRIATFQHEELIHDVTWSQDNSELLVSGLDNGFVWDIESQQKKFDNLTPATQDAQFLRASWSDDERYILTHRAGRHSGKQNVIVWDGATGEFVHELTLTSAFSDLEGSVNEENVQISDAFWLHDGHEILVKSADAQTVVWDVESGELVRSWEFDPIRVQAVDRQNRLLLMINADPRLSTQSVLIWDIERAQPHLQLEVPSTKLGAFNSLLAWNNSQSQLAVVENATGEVHVFDLDTRDPLTQLALDSGIIEIKYSGREGEVAIIETRLGEVIAWDIAAQTQQMIIAAQTGGVANRIANYWWRNDGTIWVAHEDGNIDVHDLDTGTSTTINHPTPLAFAHGHDASMFVTVDKAGTVRIWNSETKTIVYTLEGHAAAAHINLNGTHIWTHAGESNVRIWDALTGRLLHELPVQGAAALNINDPAYIVVSNHPIYLPDSTIEMVNEPSTVTFWNVDQSTQDPLKELSYEGVMGFITTQNSHNIALVSLDLSSTGLPRYLEDSAPPLLLEVWDMVQVEPKISTQLRDRVVDRIWSQANEFIFVITELGELIVFNVETGEIHAEIGVAGTKITAVAFGQTDDEVIVGTSDGRIQLHTLDGEKIIDEGCQLVNRNLTFDEWLDYFPNQPYRTTCLNLPPHPSFLDAIQGKAKAEDVVAFFGDEANVIYREDETFSANRWNDICWWGSLWGYHTDVIFACENAVAQSSENDKDFYRGALGMNYALNDDLSAALTEIQSFVAYLENWIADLEQAEDGNSNLIIQLENILETRYLWLEALQNGENPFDEVMLATLRDESND